MLTTYQNYYIYIKLPKRDIYVTQSLAIGYQSKTNLRVESCVMLHQNPLIKRSLY